jgi:hypothetical protein
MNISITDERNCRFLPEEYFSCECSVNEHTIRLIYCDELETSGSNVYDMLSDGSELKYDDSIYLLVYLERDSFLKRIRNATKYIFNIERPYGDFGSTIIREEDYKRFTDFLLKIRDVQIVTVLGKKYIDINNEENTVRISVSHLHKDMYERVIWVFLKKEKSVFKRMKKAIKYIFGYQSNLCSGSWDEFEIKKEHVNDLLFLFEKRG